MPDQIYRDLMEKFARRGGRYPGMDVPEFYELAEELFTPEQAAVAAVIIAAATSTPATTGICGGITTG